MHLGIGFVHGHDIIVDATARQLCTLSNLSDMPKKESISNHSMVLQIVVHLRHIGPSKEASVVLAWHLRFINRDTSCAFRKNVTTTPRVMLTSSLSDQGLPVALVGLYI